jgi:hypothetical protein
MSLHAAMAKIRPNSAKATAIKGVLSKKEPAIEPYIAATAANSQIYLISCLLVSNNALIANKGQ